VIYKNKAKRISSKIVFDSKFVVVREDKIDEHGKLKNFYIIEAIDLVGVIIHHKDKGILLVKQLRYTHNEYFLGLPGGWVEKGESFEQGAKRECIEETGLEPEKLDFFTDVYIDVGQSAKMIKIYIAKDFKKIKTEIDKEIDSHHWFSLKEIRTMLLNEQIKDPIAELVLAKLLLKK
jgi:ADP-ribose pyrophosphatase